jgi:hypothetical protein
MGIRVRLNLSCDFCKKTTEAWANAQICTVRRKGYSSEDILELVPEFGEWGVINIVYDDDQKMACPKCLKERRGY